MKLNGIDIGPRPKTAYALLMRVKELVLAEPTRLDMNNWLIQDRTSLQMREQRHGIPAPMCGTVGCIAGWSIAVTKPSLGLRRKVGHLKGMSGYASSGALGAYLLGGTLQDILDVDGPEEGMYSELFFTSKWPNDLRERLSNLDKPGTPEYAEIVAERIDRFAAEHKRKLQRASLAKRLTVKK